MLRRIVPSVCGALMCNNVYRASLSYNFHHQQNSSINNSSNSSAALTQSQRSIYEYKFGQPPLTFSFEAQGPSSANLQTAAQKM